MPTRPGRERRIGHRDQTGWKVDEGLGLDQPSLLVAILASAVRAQGVQTLVEFRLSLGCRVRVDLFLGIAWSIVLYGERIRMW